MPQDSSILTPVAKKKLDDFFKRLQLDGADAARAEAHGAIRATGGGTSAATLSGDVTGRLSATVVGRILGRLLATTAPVAGQALVYDGTSWVPTSIGVGGPTTTYTNWALTAQGATATASSTQSPYAADLTIDGDDSTFWSDAYGNEVANEWVRIDLGAARAIDYFRLYQFPSDTYGATSCKIQSSTDGSTWTDRHTISGIFTDTGVIALASGLVTARYWRLYGLGGPPVAYSHQWRVNAIELLESATLTPTVYAPTDAHYVTTQAEAGLSAEVLLSAVIGHGLLSARPAAGTAGRLYYATDGPALYRDNGSSWDTLLTSGGTAAPVDATYVTRTANGTLTNEVLLSQVYARELKTRYEPLTNGDPIHPEIFFMDGEVLMMEVDN
jgi:trimeric autotransporter adhesin